MIKLQLAPNWEKLHKSFTVILSFLAATLSFVEVVLPHMGLIQPFLDPATYGFLMFSMSVSIGIGRYIKQECLQQKENKDE